MQYQESGQGRDPGDIGRDRMRQEGAPYQAALHHRAEAGVRGDRTSPAHDYISADFFGVQPSGSTDPADQKYDRGGSEQEECPEYIQRAACDGSDPGRE